MDLGRAFPPGCLIQSFAARYAVHPSQKSRCDSLLEIAHLLEANREGKITAGDESHSKNENSDINIGPDPNTPSVRGENPSAEPNFRDSKGRVPGSDKATDQSGRRVRHSKPTWRAQ